MTTIEDSSLAAGTEVAGTETAFVGFGSPDLGQAELDEVLETLRSGWLIAGPRVKAFERLLGERLGADHVTCLSSCSAALLLALRCAGVGRDDEVLLPAITFAGCANVVEQLGAKPVLVDVDSRTGLIDLDHAATLAGERTAALMAVHLGGRPLDRERLNGFRRRHGILVVEDAAHAIGAACDGRPVGAYGNPTAFSFHATKNMTSIEGGALACQSEAHAERVERLAGQGISTSAWDRHGSGSPADYDVIEPGYKLAMTDVSAAVGIHQLRRLDAAIDRREELRCRYDEALRRFPLDLEPDVEPGMRHARHLYAVRVREDAPIGRDALAFGLHQRGIGSSIHFKALHELTHFGRRCAVEDGDLPGADDWSRRTLSLPLYPSLPEQDQERVVAALEELLGR